MKKPKTNIEFINEFMSFGSPLKQAFVIEALRRYAESCSKYTDEFCESFNKENQNPFINMFTWREIARNYQKEYNEYFKK